MTDAGTPPMLWAPADEARSETALGRYHAAMRPTCELSVMAEGERAVAAVGEH